MPRLLIFAPCEKVLVDEQSQNISLVGILDLVSVFIPPESTIPADIILPLQWKIFTLWLHTPGDDGKKFEQRTYLTVPDGTEGAEMIVPFEFSTKKHRITAPVANFPVAQEGDCFVHVALREVGQDQEWQEIAAFPLTVVHMIPVSS